MQNNHTYIKSFITKTTKYIIINNCKPYNLKKINLKNILNNHNIFPLKSEITKMQIMQTYDTIYINLK